MREAEDPDFIVKQIKYSYYPKYKIETQIPQPELKNGIYFILDSCDAVEPSLLSYPPPPIVKKISLGSNLQFKEIIEKILDPTGDANNPPYGSIDAITASFIKRYFNSTPERVTLVGITNESDEGTEKRIFLKDKFSEHKSHLLRTTPIPMGHADEEWAYMPSSYMERILLREFEYNGSYLVHLMIVNCPSYPREF